MFIFGTSFHEIISTAILPLPLIQEEQLSVIAKICALSTGYLPRGGLPRNSVDRITDRPDMTAAVDRGRKAATQQTYKIFDTDTSRISEPREKKKKRSSGFPTRSDTDRTAQPLKIARDLKFWI